MIKTFRPSFFITLLFSLFVKLAVSQTGGPDAYGYTWKQYRAAGGAKWIEITNRPDVLDLTSRIKKGRNIGPINFSFDFPYYWYHHNKLYVNSLGYISFNPITIGYPIARIPRAGGQGDDFIAGMIAPHSFNGSTGKLYFWSDFKDSLIITFEDVPYFITTTQTGGANTFQMVLSRKDSAILFQYARHEGSFANTPCPGTTPDANEDVPICQMIGIENITGQVGLLHSVNDESIFVALSKADPLAIKFSPSKVLEKKYETKDLAVKWNNNPQNGGFFVSKGGPALTLKSNIKNQGTATSPISQVTGTLKKGSTKISQSKSIKLDTLSPEQEKMIAFDNKLSTKDEGIYSLETKIAYTDDKYQPNNTSVQLISVVDTTGEVTTLDYSNGESAGTGFTFLGATPQCDRGIGVYIEPPYYPAKITGVKFGVGGYPTTANPPSNPIRVRLFNDYGTNVFNERDGSPGDTIYEKDLIPEVEFINGYNTFELDKELEQINSGGVYLALMQCGQGISYNINNVAPSSGRSYEVNDPGGFLLYRNRHDTDFLLGIDVVPGDLSKVSSLALTKLLSPLETDEITDSVEVKMEMSNIGNKDVAGPFDVSFKADEREEIVEQLPVSTTIKVGEIYTYTFKTKSPRPPQPRTKYEKFCAKINPPNDFNKADNQICYGAIGIEQISEINNLLLFPNPSNGNLNVVFGLKRKSVINLEVYDKAGRIVFARNIGQNTTGLHQVDISLPELPNGIYTCRFVSTKGVAIEKLSIFR